jgi:hypothetical protein
VKGETEGSQSRGQAREKKRKQKKLPLLSNNAGNYTILSPMPPYPNSVDPGI